MRLELRPGVTIAVTRLQIAEFVGAVLLALVEIMFLWNAVAADRVGDSSAGVKYALAAVVISVPTGILIWRWQRVVKAALAGSD